LKKDLIARLEEAAGDATQPPPPPGDPEPPPPPPEPEAETAETSDFVPVQPGETPGWKKTPEESKAAKERHAKKREEAIKGLSEEDIRVWDFWNPPPLDYDPWTPEGAALMRKEQEDRENDPEYRRTHRRELPWKKRLKEIQRANRPPRKPWSQRRRELGLA